MDIPTYMMKLENSDVIGMFYEIIEKFLISIGLIAYGKINILIEVADD